MLNLNGYHFQGLQQEIFDSLIVPPAYVGSYQTRASALSYPDFLDGKKCYICYGQKMDPDETYPLDYAIDYFYGPYYFGFDVVPLTVFPNWKTTIQSHIGSAAVVLPGIPDNCGVPFGYAMVCWIGTPAPGATSYLNLPADGFCGNNNGNFARPDCFHLAQYVYRHYLDKFTFFGQYKLNHRYASTSGRIANFDRDLPTYRNGYRSWATGWTGIPDSCYYYLRDQHPTGLQPRCAKYPYPSAYTNASMTLTPNLQFALNSDAIYPLINSTDVLGYPVNLSFIRFDSVLLDPDILVENGCSKFGDVLINDPLNQYDMHHRFDRQSYPSPNTEPFQPCYHFCYFFSTGKIGGI